MHLKRIAMPKNWPLPRKGKKKFVPYGKNAIPLLVIVRDMLKITHTKKETKKILQEGIVLVDNKTRKDERFPVGLFDIIAIPKLKKAYRLVIKGGKFCLEEIKETNMKTCKVIGKKILRNKKIQINLYDGKNFIHNKEVRVGDSVIVDLAQNKVVGHLPLKEGCKVIVVSGSHAGFVGSVEKISKKVTVKNSKIIEIPRKNLFVVEK